MTNKAWVTCNEREKETYASLKREKIEKLERIMIWRFVILKMLFPDYLIHYRDKS